MSRDHLDPPAGSPESADLARHILQRLGEGGQPPEYGVDRVNVGNDQTLRVLEHEYFRGLLRHGASFKLVQGYFGGGKTHFLYCVRELAWRYGFVTAVVELSPTECPYDDAFKVYQAVARRVAMPPRVAMQAPGYGLAELLRALVDDKLAAAEGVRVNDHEARRDVERWLRTVVGRAPCESPSFRQAVVGFCLAHLAEDHYAAAPLEAWLMGEPVPPSEVRHLGVYEQLSRANGFTMLRCLTQMMRGLELAGTALLFDEVDRNLSVSAKRSHVIGDNLRQVIDLCGRSQLPSTLFMYAVPPEFMRQVVPDYPALQQRLKSPVPLSVKSPQAALIDLERLDLEPTELLVELADKVVGLFEEARGAKLDRALHRDNARHLATAAVDAAFEINHRRLFVKTWVDLLNRQLVDGEKRLSAASAQALVRTGQADLVATGDTGAANDDFEDF